MAKVKISELPSLSPATLDTTYVVGVSGSTTYKISINQLTSSLDTTFATDSSSFNSRIISGSAVAGTISGSSQISALGFVTGSYTTINSFNNLTQSFNSISQSFTTISGSFGSIDFSGINGITASYLSFTQSYYSASASFDNRIISGSAVAGTISSSAQITAFGFLSTSTDLSSLNTISASYLSFTQSYYSASASFDSRVDSLENATSSYLTSLNGAISSSTQVLNGSGIFSSSAQLPTGLVSGSSQIFIGSGVASGSYETTGRGIYSSSAQLPIGLVSGSSQILNGSGIFSSSAQLPTGIISSSAQLENATITNLTITNLTTVNETSSVIYSSGSNQLGDALNDTQILSGSIKLVGTGSLNGYTILTSNDTASFLTTLNGAISSSTQVLNSSGIFSSSAQLPTGLISSSTQFPSNLISGSSQISTLGFITGSYISSSTYTTDSASFNSRIISGSAVAGTISGSSQISALGYATTSSVTTISASAWGAFQSASSYSSSLATSISASNYNITINSASVSSISSSFVTSISASNASITALSSSNATTDNTQTTNITAASASAWGAFQSASSYSSSVSTSLSLVSASLQSSISASNYNITINSASLVTSITNLNTYTSSMNTWTSSLSAIGTLNTDYIHAGRITSDQVGVGVGSDVIFNSTVVSSGISMNTSTGVFTLTAGKTYRLFGSVGFVNFSSATGWFIYQWVDATTNAALDTTGISVAVAEALNRDVSEFNATSANLIYTPSTNQTVKLRITDGNGTTTIRSSIGTKATIEQINPSVALNQFATLQVSGSLSVTGSLTTKGNATIGTGSGNEGGEIDLAFAQNTTLTGSIVVFDVYSDKVRIFEGGGNNRGVSIDLSKAPASVGGELMWKKSGYVDAGTFLTLDNVKVTIPTSGNRGASIGAVSTTFVANISGQYGYTAGASGMSAYSVSYTTTASASAFGWSFTTEGDAATYILNDKTNSRVYRITTMIGFGFLNNFISIERLY